MYLLLKMVVFHCYVSLPKGNSLEGITRCPKKKFLPIFYKYINGTPWLEFGGKKNEFTARSQSKYFFEWSRIQIWESLADFLGHFFVQTDKNTFKTYENHLYKHLEIRQLTFIIPAKKQQWCFFQKLNPLNIPKTPKNVGGHICSPRLVAVTLVIGFVFSDRHLGRKQNVCEKGEGFSMG